MASDRDGLRDAHDLIPRAVNACYLAAQIGLSQELRGGNSSSIISKGPHKHLGVYTVGRRESLGLMTMQRDLSDGL